MQLIVGKFQKLDVNKINNILLQLSLLRGAIMCYFNIKPYDYTYRYRLQKK